MCDPVSIGIASLAISGGGFAYNAINSKMTADEQASIQRQAEAKQEKLIREATPAEVEKISTNTDRVKELNRLRRGISQSIYSDKSFQNLETKKMGE